MLQFAVLALSDPEKIWNSISEEKHYTLIDIWYLIRASDSPPRNVLYEQKLENDLQWVKNVKGSVRSCQ